MNLLIKTAKKNNNIKTTIVYEFETKCTGVAGFCPDCDSVVSFNSFMITTPILQ